MSDGGGRRPRGPALESWAIIPAVLMPRFDGAARCAETDPDAFFPDKGGSTRAAKRLCNGTEERRPCPVRAQCLAWALDNDERFGVWGGLSENERQQIRRGRAA